MADIYVNFPALRAGYIRGAIDYDLEVLVEGWGAVSGGGAGLNDPAFYVGLELDTNERTQVDRFIARLLHYLRGLLAPVGTKLVVGVDGPEGVRAPIY